jgi:hypothetical protein
MLAAKGKLKGSNDFQPKTTKRTSSVKANIHGEIRGKKKPRVTNQEDREQVEPLNSEIAPKAIESRSRKISNDDPDETRLRNVLKRKGLLSTLDATLALDLCCKLVTENPTDKSKWDLLHGVSALEELSSRRISSTVEKRLTDAIRAVLSEKCALETISACEATWQLASTNLGFRPKLEALSDMVIRSTASEPSTFLLRELLRSCEGETSRKAFEQLCDESGELFSSLVKIWINNTGKEIHTLVESILYYCLFQEDDEDEIVNACLNPRMEVIHKKKKKTNQNNWRGAFWKVLQKCLSSKLISADRNTEGVTFLTLLCNLHRRKHKEKTTLVWFEMLFMLLDLDFDDSYQLPLCIDLLASGLTWYEPTSTDDAAAFVLWVDRFIQTQAETASLPTLLTADVLRHSLKLDYRAVEPHFQQIVKLALEAPSVVRLEMLIVILDTYILTRRVGQWIELVFKLSLETETDLESWFDGDVQLQSNFRARLARLFKTKLVEHQYAEIWHIILDKLNDTRLCSLNRTDILITAIDSFLATFPCGRSFVSTFEEVDSRRTHSVLSDLKWIEKASSFARSCLHSGSQSDTRLLGCIQLLQTTVAASNLSDLTFPNDEPMDVIDDKTFAALKRLVGENKLNKSEGEQIILKEIATLCLECTSRDDVVDWCFEMMSELDLMHSILRNLLCRINFDKSPRLAMSTSVWESIVIKSNPQFTGLLGKAWFYEIEQVQKSFERFIDRRFLAKGRQSAAAPICARLLTIVTHFPVGFLTETVMIKIVSIAMAFTEMEGSIADQLCDFLVKVIGPVDAHAISKVFNNSAVELVSFLNKTSSEKMQKHVIDLFILHCPASEIQTLASHHNHYYAATVMTALSRRIEAENDHRINENVAQIAKNILLMTSDIFVGEEVKQDFSMLTLGASKLTLVKQLVTKTKMEYSFSGVEAYPLAQLLATSATVLAKSEESRKFIEVCCDSYKLFNPELDPNCELALIAASMHINAAFGESQSFQHILAKAEPKIIGIIVDSMIADAWSIDSMKQESASRNIRTLLEFRLHWNSHQPILKRSRPLLACIMYLLNNAEQQNAWEALMSFISVDALRETMNGRDLIVILTPTCPSIAKIRFMQLICSVHPKLVSGKAAAVFANVISQCERELIFSESLKDVQVSSRAAMELARLCEELKPLSNAFRHHTTAVLANHITLCYLTGAPYEGLRRPLELIGFYLLDICSEHELQQLHVILGGGVGGARREAFRKLTVEHQKTHVFKGKV